MDADFEVLNIPTDAVDDAYAFMSNHASLVDCGNMALDDMEIGTANCSACWLYDCFAGTFNFWLGVVFNSDFSNTVVDERFHWLILGH
jgi:hypothetical protein